MSNLILGSEALARHELTRGQLRARYRSIFPNVYAPRDVEPTLRLRAEAAYLWSGRRGLITGRAAAAVHRTEWLDDDAPVELLWTNHHPPPGIITRDERFTYDEVWEIDDMPVACPQRAAFDVGRFMPKRSAIAVLDALGRATGMNRDVMLPLADQYKGARGVRAFRAAVDLVDIGAASPKETWLRLLLIDAGFPRPTTQIPVIDLGSEPFAYLDMGWEDVMIAVEYDGDQHRTDRIRYAWDVKRLRRIQDQGWIHIRVIAEDRPYEIIERVRRAWAHREAEARVVRRAI